MSDLSEYHPAKADSEVHSIEFKGQTGEYFGIWIVNVLLSIVTLGIFSAWAKVRYKKYFYGSTFIDGHNFDYHATGPQILIGRLIVLGAYLIIFAAAAVSDILYGILILILFASIGWLLARAVRFNARMTSYRNVRFDFVGSGAEAWLIYVLYPILIYFGVFLLGLGLLFVPFLSRTANKWLINNSRYGDRPFEFVVEIGEYYKPYLTMIAVIILAIISGIAVSSIAFGGLSEVFAPTASSSTAPLILGIYGFIFLVIFPASLIYSVAVRNIMFNHTVLDSKHEFYSTVKVLPFAWIVISNAVAALLTIGLMIPWGRIRLARYMAANTKFVSGGNLDNYSSSVIESGGVSAAEYADIEGFDIDIGI